MKNTIYLTCKLDCSNLYAPGHKEGFGSAIQMVIAAYTIARYLGVGFHFEPLVNIGHCQDAYTQDEWDKRFNDYAREFLLPGCATLTKGNVVNNIDHTLDGISHFINSFKLHTDQENPFVINLNWQWMKQIFDQNIQIFNNIKKELVDNYIEKSAQFLNDHFDDEVYTIAIHVRKLNSNDCDPATWRDLYSPNQPVNNYIRIANELDRRINQKYSAIDIFSQGNPSDFYEFIEQLETWGRTVQLHLNEDPIKTLHYLILADDLVMSKSSYSYIASMYRYSSYVNKSFQHTLTEGTYIR